MDEELEKTKALNELVKDVKKHTEAEKINLPDDVEVLDSDDTESKEEVFEKLTTNDEEKTDKKDKKKKTKFKDKINNLKEKWNKLSKKQKIIILSVAGTIFLILVGVILYIILDGKKPGPEETKEEESIVLEKDNYIYKDGRLTLLDTNDNPIGEYDCTNKNEELCYVAYLDNDEDPFYVDINQDKDNNIIKTRSSIYQERFVFIFDNEAKTDKTIHLYDLKDNKTIEDFNGVKSYKTDNPNIIILKNNQDQYGLFELNYELKKLIDFKYSFLGIIDKDKDTLVVAESNKGTFLIDYNDKVKTKAYNGRITDYNDEYVILKNNGGKFYVYNYNGEEKVKDYDYIKMIENKYLACIKDKHIFLKDFENNKYNEEGIEIVNEEYQKINYFDENNKSTNSKFSFDYELHADTLTFKIQSNDNTTRDEKINLKEGDISKKYKYYSYFNSMLYFYDDEEKTNIIGKYQCDNENSFANDSFDKCFVAKDTYLSDTYINPKKDVNAVIPIFAKKYAFINDSMDPERTKLIKFKDITDKEPKKVLGTYSLVDANTPDGTNDLTFNDSNAVTIIVCDAKSSKYGVLTVNNGTASAKYKISYKYIERLDNNFLVQQDNNNWKILYSNSAASSEFPGKVMNYKNGYLIIRNNNQDYVYKGDGEAVVNTGFKYAVLMDRDIFAGVTNNNRLEIYTYAGKKKDEFSLLTNEYYGTNTPAFRIELLGNSMYRLYVYNGSSYENRGEFSYKEEEQPVVNPTVDPTEDNNQSNEGDDNNED